MRSLLLSLALGAAALGLVSVTPTEAHARWYRWGADYYYPGYNNYYTPGYYSPGYYAPSYYSPYYTPGYSYGYSYYPTYPRYYYGGYSPSYYGSYYYPGTTYYYARPYRSFYYAWP
jgi:hypothetical protein